MTQKDYAKSLRLIADWYEKQPPNIPVPFGGISVDCFIVNNPLPPIAKALGQAEKRYSGLFKLEKDFAGVTLRFQWFKDQVCERKVIGKKIIPAYSYPEHEEDIVEWNCPDSVLPIKPPLKNKE